MSRTGDALRHPVALVVAVADNAVIGKDGGLPWRLPGDLAYFKRVTMGKPVVMGRRTWDSLPRKPLPGRPNLVVSRRADFDPGVEGAEAFTSLEAALKRADALLDDAAGDVDTPEVCVIGGADLFRETLDRADRLYLTEVHAEPAGDTYFPKIDRKGWREVARDSRPAAGAEAPAHAFVLLQRP